MYKFILLMLIFSFYSCNNDDVKKNDQLIIGDWLLDHATRNDKVSKTLEHTTYTFNKDLTLKTNLFKNEVLKYNVDGQIVQQTGQTPLTYNILKLTLDSLTLETDIGKHHYVLSMIKQHQVKK